MLVLEVPVKQPDQPKDPGHLLIASKIMDLFPRLRRLVLVTSSRFTFGPGGSPLTCTDIDELDDYEWVHEKEEQLGAQNQGSGNLNGQKEGEGALHH